MTRLKLAELTSGIEARVCGVGPCALPFSHCWTKRH
jgi:hypothetical protein